MIYPSAVVSTASMFQLIEELVPTNWRATYFQKGVDKIHSALGIS